MSPAIKEEKHRRWPPATAYRSSATTCCGASYTSRPQRRRWRWLWRSSGAVNLDKRSYSHVDRYVFLDDADAALAGHHVPVRKLTFRYVEGEDDDPFAHEESMSYEDDVHDALLDMADCLERLCSPAARHVEDFRFGIYFGPAAHTPGSGRLYKLRIGDLPSRALRVLHMSKCMDFAGVVVAPFPRLVELRLHLCDVSLETLQGVIDAAPLLATLHLDGAELSCYSGSLVRLRCPKVATLGMDNFNFHQTMELHAPALRCFTYKGPVRAFTLLPQDTMNRTRVHLQFQVPRHQGSDDQTCRLFWHFVQNFSNANIIKLSVQPPDLFYYHWRDLYVPISN